MSATGWTPVDESAAPTGWTPVTEPIPSQAPVPSPNKLAPLGNQQPVQMAGISPAQQAWEDIKAGKYGQSALDVLGPAISAISPLAMVAAPASAIGEAGGIKAALPTVARTVGGAALGSAGGSYAGGRLGEVIGGPEGKKWGEMIGGILGGLASGEEAYRTRPQEPLKGPNVPITQSPYYNPAEYRAGRSIGPTGTATVPAATTPTATLPGVSVIPEPRPTFEGEQPNYMASVPRSTLPKAAAAGKPGAGTQLQQLGKTVIYAPSGAGIESPDISALQERMSPAAQEAFGPQFTAEQYGDGTTRQVTLHQGGQQQGYVLYDIDPKGVASVNSSLIGDPKLQGNGLGVQMYQKAIEDARAAGASSFQSGDTPEPGAVRVWESLRKSYPVEKVGSGYRIDLGEQSVAK